MFPTLAMTLQVHTAALVDSLPPFSLHHMQLRACVFVEAGHMHMLRRVRPTKQVWLDSVHG